MTETTTQDRTETEDLLGAAEQAARDAGAKTVATIRSDQQRFDDGQVAILRQLGIENASQGDLDLFFHVCKTTGLDPFRRQIYMVGRNTKVTDWVERNGRRERVDNWVTKWTIQTGIDGYRRNGREAAKALGDSLAFDGPYWCGEDGVWKEVWPSKDVPVAAKFTIFRNGEPFSAVVHYDEFVQTNAVYEGSGSSRQKVSDAPNSMWEKMPRNQTAKCAEAMAWRRAYPDDFAGLVYADAAQPTVIDQDGNVESQPAPKRQGGRGTDGLRSRAQAARKSDVIDGEVTTEETASDSGAKPEPEQVSNPAPSPADAPTSDLRTSMRKQLNTEIAGFFGELDLLGDDQANDRLVVVCEIVGRKITSPQELVDDELQKLRNGLVERKSKGTLAADVTEWLNVAELRRLEAQQVAEEAAAAGPADDEPAES